jgi:hypothetical protein
MVAIPPAESTSWAKRLSANDYHSHLTQLAARKPDFTAT